MVHGTRLVDEYRWLRDKDSARVRSHLETENAHTRAVMAFTEPLQETLYREMLARIQETDMDVPYRYGAFEYYGRTEQGQDYPILCRRALDDPAEQVTLDMNTMAEGHEFFALGAYDVSPDARLLAFSTDVTGFREYTLQVKDLSTGGILPLRVEKARSVAWANDSATLFYVVEDDAKRAYRLYRHRLGSAAHDLLYEETDERFSIGVDETRSSAFVILTSHSATTSGCVSSRRIAPTRR
jgi:oligopeptidase B